LDLIEWIIKIHDDLTSVEYGSFSSSSDFVVRMGYSLISYLTNARLVKWHVNFVKFVWPLSSTTGVLVLVIPRLCHPHVKPARTDRQVVA